MRKRTHQKRGARRKAEVLAAFADYLLKNGMLDLSLRPAAAALRTSPRMLVYYFGSKERLLLAAIQEVRARERARFAREIQRRRFGSVADDVWVLWRWFSGKAREPYLRLFYELYARAASRPRAFKHLLDLVSEGYLSLMTEGLVSWGFSGTEARTHATLYLAAFRGLLLDLLTTGERRRVDAAVRVLAANLEVELVKRRPALDREHPLPPSLRSSLT